MGGGGDGGRKKRNVVAKEKEKKKKNKKAFVPRACTYKTHSRWRHVRNSGKMRLTFTSAASTLFAAGSH